MGFGMKKEVYSRKPRKPFITLKRFIKEEGYKTQEAMTHPKFSKASAKENKPYNPNDWLVADRTPLVIASFLIVGLAFGVLIILYTT